jgi:hypothetical protein
LALITAHAAAEVLLAWMLTGEQRGFEFTLCDLRMAWPSCQALMNVLIHQGFLLQSGLSCVAMMAQFRPICTGIVAHNML